MLGAFACFGLRGSRLKKNILLLLFPLLFVYVAGKCQDAEAFNKVYTTIYLETAQTNMPAALEAADSLYRVSESPLFKTKSLMLTATLYQQKEELKKSISYAEKAKTIIEATSDFDWQVRVYGFLATQYRLLQLYNKSWSYSTQALKLVDNLTNPDAFNSTRGLMLQELAHYEMARQNYKAAIKYVKASQVHFNLVPRNKDFLTMNNEQLLGQNFYHLKQFDSAAAYYKRGLNLGATMPDNFIKGLIYNGMASVYIEKEKLTEAKKYLDKAEKIADASGYLQLKKEVYKTAELYHAKARNIDELAAAIKRKDTIADQLNNKTASFLNDTYSQLETNKEKAEYSSKLKTAFALAVSMLFVSSLILFSRRSRKQKHQFERFKEIIRMQNEHNLRLEQEFLANSTDKNTAVHSKDEEITNGPVTAAPSAGQALPVMRPETEKKLLDVLFHFEHSDLYLSRELSLSSLAAHFNTNTRYLSDLIKKHRQKDFNKYINELRINYIITKLQDDNEWRQYKISALAEAAGFSSHSKFAAIFKDTTGLSPSLFIKYLQQEEDKKRG
jgi:AraC-like DNA-binding protein